MVPNGDRVWLWFLTEIEFRLVPTGDRVWLWFITEIEFRLGPIGDRVWLWFLCDGVRSWFLDVPRALVKETVFFWSQSK